MAYDQRGPMTVFSPRQPAFLSNFLLLLIAMGLIVIILLMLFWFPYRWGGARIVGSDGKVVETSGGGIVVNAACCDNQCPGTPPTTPPTTPPCEDYCKTVYANTPQYYDQCVRERCGQTPPPTTPPCEDYCKKTYANTPQYYDQCVRERCGETPTTPPTTPPTTAQLCVDSDGSDTSTPGQVTFNGKTYSDSCADKMRITEWICRDGQPASSVMTCPRGCKDSACY